MFRDYYQGRHILVTGHTGFKGSWLCEWLLSLGAKVTGYALDPLPHEVLYGQLGLSERLEADHRGDIGDLDRLAKVVSDSKPEIVFHLAAQPLVRLSYEIPIATFATNTMGTAHLLEAVRLAKRPCAVVCVTTDKCYENQEWLSAYRETDAMGGHDPYSASKGAAELVISSYRNSFFSHNDDVRVASARAGNVIGGGDWALDRIIPDCVRGIREGRAIEVRNRVATRPWQHVLEPLSGYLWLGVALAREAGLEAPGDAFSSPFNFGPELRSNRTVAELVQEFLKSTGGEWVDASDPESVHEASKLNLATDKAFHLLGWQPVWNFPKTLAMTAEWYLTDQKPGVDRGELTRRQIESYQESALECAVRWTAPK